MAQKKRKIKYVIIILIFVIYFVTAARPVPKEIVLAPAWLSSLGSIPSFGLAEEFPELSDNPDPGLYFLSSRTDIQRGAAGASVPYTLGSRFGFVDASGQFAINKIKSNEIYLSQNMWTEYGAEPANIAINNISDGSAVNIASPGGYPILLDNKIFILGSEQNSLAEIDKDGSVIWSYEFGAPLTAIDAASDLVVTGSLDGAVEVFNLIGERVFYFEPGGSRYSIILGCAISRNGSRIGIISGIDQQRFLLLERLGSSGDYKVVYHEFLETGFRRPVRVLFIDDDQRVVYERSGGLGCYNIRSRYGMFIPLDGEIAAFDGSGERGFFFLITSHGQVSDDFLSGKQLKKLVGIKFPQDKFLNLSRIAASDTIFIKAPFKSDDVFIGRTQTAYSDSRVNSGLNGSFELSGNSMLIAGGGTSLISFVIEEI